MALCGVVLGARSQSCAQLLNATRGWAGAEFLACQGARSFLTSSLAPAGALCLRAACFKGTSPERGWPGDSLPHGSSSSGPALCSAVSLGEGFRGSSLVAPWGACHLFCPRAVARGARQGLGGMRGPSPGSALRPPSAVTERLVADPHGSAGRPPGLCAPASAVQRRDRRHHPGPPNTAARGCALWAPPGGQAAGGEGGQAQLPSPGE